jgi:hypothetical protein
MLIYKPILCQTKTSSKFDARMEKTMSFRRPHLFAATWGLSIAFFTFQLFALQYTPANPWARWQFLVGSWEGTGSGEPGEGAGTFSFAYELDGKILVRRSRVDYPPKPGEKTGLTHQDLVIVYPSSEGSSFRAIYFDTEGHVINYLVTFPEKQPAVVFESDPSQPGPRYRLTYDADAKGILAVTFSIAPPGGPFKVYVAGTSRRKQ